MLRRLFKFLSALSLLLCVATCVLWVQTYTYNSRIQYIMNGGRSVSVTACCPAWVGLRRLDYGTPVLMLAMSDGVDQDQWGTWHAYSTGKELDAWYQPPWERPQRSGMGVTYWALDVGGSNGTPGVVHQCHINFWLPAVLTSILPVLLVFSRLHFGSLDRRVSAA